MPNTRHPPLSEGVVTAIADALGETSIGLTGSEIGRILAQLGFEDPGPDMTKRHRLAVALINQQRKDNASNGIIRFVAESMSIGRYLGRQERFEELRDVVDPALSLAGLRIRDDGRVGRLGRKATTFDEVAALTGRLLAESQRRGVHDQVLAYCREELIRQSTFHAVSEAVKGACDRLRTMTGLILDGSELIDACFSSSKGRPLVTINDWETKSEASEHTGFANLLRGVIGTFRNPTAHAPRVAWPVSESDALDVFSTLSYIHRRLDAARTRRP
ncbi:MAG: TIGR02391 family protein [Croceicoccus sp.]|nr:TIGR02391 family protein [Croceicoccus sp.]MAY50577.1 TIGR02391 family protein [Microbacterium sp.]